MRVRRSRIEEDGRARAATAPALTLRILDDMSRYLAACQVGITFTSLGIGFLGEPAIGRRSSRTCSARACRTGSPRPSRSALAYLITTSLHITIGEQIPKIYSIEKAEQTALRIARPLYLSAKRLPAVDRGRSTAPRTGCCGAIGINTAGEFEEGGSPEELKQIIAQSLVGGHIDPGEAGDAHGRLPPARAAGAPGDDAGARARHRRRLRGRRDRAAALRLLRPHAPRRHRGEQPGPRARPRARQPARAGADRRRGPTRRSSSSCATSPIVPETKPLDDLLADLQRERASMAS